MRSLFIAFYLAAFVATDVSGQKPATVPRRPVSAPTKPATASTKPATARPRADINAPGPEIPELPRPRLKLAEGPVIAGRKEQFDMLNGVLLGPGGQMIVHIGWRTLQAYDSTGRRLWKKEFGNDDEIGTIDHVGWRGAQMWIFDSRFSQVALLDRGVVTKSLEVPSWIRPTWANRKTFPIFGHAEVRALYADGSMLVVPFNPHSIVGTVGYDSTAEYVVNVAESGIIKKTITKYPSADLGSRSARARAERAQSQVGNRWIFAPEFWPYLRVSADGMRIITVSVDTAAATADSIVVAAFSNEGASIYTRKFGFPRSSLTEQQIDSIAAVRITRGDAETRASLKRMLPRKVASVRDVIVGRDYSVWVTLSERGGAKPTVGIDPAGQIIGTIYIPRTFQLKAADGPHVWAADYRFGLKDLVRYSYVKP